MKLKNTDYKKGTVSLKIDNLDDLWYLSHILEKDDQVSALTYRKIKLGDGDERKTKIIKKKLWLKVTVEKISFAVDTHQLRVSGTITEGTDDIASGSYHTLAIELDSELNINKNHSFMEYQIKKLKESSENKPSTILLCALDRENAYFALLKNYGYELLLKLNGDVPKKQFAEAKKISFYSAVSTKLKEFVERHKLSKIIIGCPGFWKNEISHELEKNGIVKLVSFANCSAEGENTLKEILKRPETKEVLANERFSIELNLVDKLLSEISKQGNVEYGIKQVIHASELGAVNKLLVTDNFIERMRQDEKYVELDNIMKSVDVSKGEINIISSVNDAGIKLDGLGGIAAFLRFKID